jgi:hypothetical protein
MPASATPSHIPCARDRMLQIRDECFADDLDIPDDAVGWSEEALYTFFMSGGAAAVPPIYQSPRTAAATSAQHAALRRILDARPDDHHAVLNLTGLSDTSTANVLTKAFRQQCLLVHPDKNPDSRAAEAFKRLQSANDALRAKLMPPAVGGCSAEPTGAAVPPSEDDPIERRGPRPMGLGDPEEDCDDLDGDLWDYYYWRKSADGRPVLTRRG